MRHSPNAISVGDDVVLHTDPRDVTADPPTCLVWGVPTGGRRFYWLELPNGRRVTANRAEFRWPA